MTRYEYTGTESNHQKRYHVDKYVLHHPDGSMTSYERQRPFRKPKKRG